MITISIPLSEEMWDEDKEVFILPDYKDVCLEHSLVSISKWESKWHKPFLSKEAKTYEETIDYIKCMTITQNVPDSVYDHITNENVLAVRDYIDNPMTATWFNENNNAPNRSSNEQVTSELVYYWMIALNVPMECQRWHLNRLLTLIKVCNIKNQPAKKMSNRDIISRNAALNAARRKQFNSKG